MKARLLLALCLCLIALSKALAAPECPAGSAGKPELLPAAADQIDEAIASPEEVARLSVAGNGPAPHPLMAVRYVIDSNVAVTHRVERVAAGRFCDAPEAVVFRFGVVRRRVILVPEAAADACVRSALLTHEAEHDRIVGEAVRVFLLEQRAEVSAEVDRLKRQPAGNAEAAKKTMEAGLISATARLVERFNRHAVGRIRRLVDSPARLQDLGTLCDGRIAELERSVKRDGNDL